MKRPSAALIVASAALWISVVGTGAAATHYLITSTKQIKPSVLAQLRGRTGPKGATGSFNTHNLHVVTGSKTQLDVAGSGTAFATCPASAAVVSGGYSTSLYAGQITISQPNGNGWSVTAISNAGASGYIQAIAVCAG